MSLESVAAFFRWVSSYLLQFVLNDTHLELSNMIEVRINNEISR